MQSFVIRKTIQLIMALLVLLGVSALPSLIVQMRPDFSNYFKTVEQQLNLLTTWDTITYYNATAAENRLLFPDLEPFIQETLLIFSSALICSAVAALLYAFLFYQAGPKIRSLLTQVTRTLEMVPDLFWVIFSQCIVIILFKTTGFNRIEIAGGADDHVRFLPILTLSLTTVFFFIKWLTGRIQEEQGSKLPRTRPCQGYPIAPSVLATFAAEPVLPVLFVFPDEYHYDSFKPCRHRIYL